MVLEKLTALQNGHRLAIHMVEHYGCHFTVLDGLMKQLKHASTIDIGKKLLEYATSDANEHLPLSSVSLLPTADSGWSMHPYEVVANTLDNYGYLVDLSQTQKPPPIILNADTETLDCGYDYSKKLERFCTPQNEELERNFNTMLKQNPALHDADPIAKRLCRAMCGSHGTTYANTMLNTLGKAPHYESSVLVYDETHHKYPNVTDYNEVLTAISSHHLAAITVPIYQSPNSEDKTYLALRTLQAALVGLNHIEAGINLPVVLYHVTPPHQGALSYVGQSKEELRRAGLNALEEMAVHKVMSLHDAFNFQAPPRPHASELLTYNVQRHLGVDLRIGETGPSGWYAQVAEKLAALTPATPSPARRPRRTSPESDGRY